MVATPVPAPPLVVPSLPTPKVVTFTDPPVWLYVPVLPAVTPSLIFGVVTVPPLTMTAPLWTYPATMEPSNVGSSESSGGNVTVTDPPLTMKSLPASLLVSRLPLPLTVALPLPPVDEPSRTVLAETVPPVIKMFPVPEPPLSVPSFPALSRFVAMEPEVTLSVPLSMRLGADMLPPATVYVWPESMFALLG